MSYSLFLHFKPRLRRADMLRYFAARKHYKTAKDRVSYQNDDTGVYFWFKLRLSWNILLRPTVVAAEFEINYSRPSFFGIEAEKELSAFVTAFNPRIEDPQMQGMGEGPYSGESFLRGWNFGNRFAVQQVAAKETDDKIVTMPAAELRAAWEWNFDCAERRERLTLRHYVPTILFWRIDGRARRIVVWGEAMPVLLPRVDYVVVARQIGKSQISLVPWSEIIEVAKRAGFDTSKEPLELRYLTPPPAFIDWATNLPLIDLKAYERLHAYQIVDEELIPTRASPAQDEVPRAVSDPPKEPPSFDQTPDKPQAFGYKVNWFAIKTSDPSAVLDALELGEATLANWASGLEAAHEGGAWKRTGPWVFISPPVRGWVLAVSASWPYPVTIEQTRDIGERFDALFSRLMQRFDDVQFFGSYRVVDFVTWARALKGKPIRIFGYAGGGDNVLANFGDQTLGEAQLGFTNLSGLSPSDANDRMFEIAEQQDLEEYRLRKNGLSPREAHEKVRESGRSPFPDETDATDLAALWSIDPSGLEEQDHPTGLGLVVRLPQDLMQ